MVKPVCHCLEGAEVNYPDPSERPAVTKADPAKDDADSDDDDDAKANEMTQKMLKQGPEYLDRQKRVL